MHVIVPVNLPGAVHNNMAARFSCQIHTFLTLLDL